MMQIYKKDTLSTSRHLNTSPASSGADHHDQQQGSRDSTIVDTTLDVVYYVQFIVSSLKMELKREATLMQTLQLVHSHQIYCNPEDQQQCLEDSLKAEISSCRQKRRYLDALYSYYHAIVGERLQHHMSTSSGQDDHVVSSDGDN